MKLSIVEQRRKPIRHYKFTIYATITLKIFEFIQQTCEYILYVLNSFEISFVEEYVQKLMLNNAQNLKMKHINVCSDEKPQKHKRLYQIFL